MRKSDLLNAMELAGLAYQEVQPGFSQGTLSVINDPETDVQCYLRRRDGVLLIAFRGSKSCRDWQTNLAFRKKVVPYGNRDSKIRVHGGFLEAYKSPAVRNVLHAMLSDDIEKIRITGHSLGAALAVLCAVDLEYNFPDRDYEVILFGAPRVGNRAFQKSYDNRVFKTLRVVNGNDIITKIPFRLMGFCHVGVPFPIGAARLPGLFTFQSHRPQAYYKRLTERLW